MGRRVRGLLVQAVSRPHPAREEQPKIELPSAVHAVGMPMGGVGRPRPGHLALAVTEPAVGKREAMGKLVKALQDAGGRLPKAERGLATRLGVRKSTLHNAVAALLEADMVARVGGQLVLRRRNSYWVSDHSPSSACYSA